MKTESTHQIKRLVGSVSSMHEPMPLFGLKTLTYLIVHDTYLFLLSTSEVSLMKEKMLNRLLNIVLKLTSGSSYIMYKKAFIFVNYLCSTKKWSFEH